MEHNQVSSSGSDEFKAYHIQGIHVVFYCQHLIVTLKESEIQGCMRAVDEGIPYQGGKAEVYPLDEEFKLTYDHELRKITFSGGGNAKLKSFYDMNNNAIILQSINPMLFKLGFVLEDIPLTRQELRADAGRQAMICIVLTGLLTALSLMTGGSTYSMFRNLMALSVQAIGPLPIVTVGGLVTAAVWWRAMRPNTKNCIHYSSKG